MRKMSGFMISASTICLMGLLAAQPVLACCGSSGGGGRDRSSVFDNMKNNPHFQRHPPRRPGYDIEGFVGSYLQYGPPPTRRPPPLPPKPPRPAMSNAVRTLVNDIRMATALIKAGDKALQIIRRTPDTPATRKLRRELQNIMRMQQRAQRKAMREAITRSVLTGQRINWH